MKNWRVYMVALHTISGKIKSDCYYSDLDLGLFDESVMSKLSSLYFKNKIQTTLFLPNYEFEKSKYVYTEEELIELEHIDFKINETTCNKRVLATDGNIYFCPGFIELKDPICNIVDFEEEKFNEYLEDFYFKKLWMCTSNDVDDIRRMCSVKHRCDKKMCYYLNKKITGENRFPFSRFCAIKELEYKNKMNKENSEVLFLILNSLTKINEALLSMGIASPDFIIRNRINQLVKEINENIVLIIKKAEEENNAIS
jgi:hypothetical protein